MYEQKINNKMSMSNQTRKLLNVREKNAMLGMFALLERIKQSECISNTSFDKCSNVCLDFVKCNASEQKDWLKSLVCDIQKQGLESTVGSDTVIKQDIVPVSKTKHKKTNIIATVYNVPDLSHCDSVELAVEYELSVQLKMFTELCAY